MLLVAVSLCVMIIMMLFIPVAMFYPVFAVWRSSLLLTERPFTLDQRVMKRDSDFVRAIRKAAWYNI